MQFARQMLSYSPMRSSLSCCLPALIMYLLGFDVGSSAVKAALVAAESGTCIAQATVPADGSLPMEAARPGWAEQHPDLWWTHLCDASHRVLQRSGVGAQAIAGIGIAYQMHGLVVVDNALQPLRPSIIWCDSRAVDIGEKAFRTLGPDRCLRTLLNSPGNFTASKLRWLQRHEPDIFNRVRYAMLPGDYLALRMTGEARTTPSGLSEGTLWNVQTETPAAFLLEHWGISSDVLPPTTPTFGVQGTLTEDAAGALGLRPGIPVAYRAGDQPNNALSLGITQPGQLAATAGTSGVVYGITDQAGYDPELRVNTFLHVNHQPDAPRYGVLLCVNGAGMLYRWLRDACSGPTPYDALNRAARLAPPGAEGLLLLPYGNGAERTLRNQTPGASLHNLHFNTHDRGHVLRAAQEGIACALVHGLQAFGAMNLQPTLIRAGNANLFQSALFTRTFATLTGATVELMNTDGAQGAARGAGVGIGYYDTLDDAFVGLTPVQRVAPDDALRAPLQTLYHRWTDLLDHTLTAPRPAS